MDLEKIGRSRLKIRLPERRQQLSEVRSPALRELCRAYAKAAMFRDLLRRSPGADRTLLDEYEVTCDEIEQDVDRLLRIVTTRMAVRRRSRVCGHVPVQGAFPLR